MQNVQVQRSENQLSIGNVFDDKPCFSVTRTASSDSRLIVLQLAGMEILCK